jgi:hypothetical protein
MRNELAVLGVSLLVVSSGFAIYGLLAGAEIVAGVALATIVFGAVVLDIGLTYRDPMVSTLMLYAQALSSPLVKMQEDLGLAWSRVVQACIGTNEVYLIYSRKELKCNDIAPGLGIQDSIPYMALVVEKHLIPESGDIEALIRNMGLAESVSLRITEEAYAVELTGLNKALIGESWGPLNIVSLLIPLLVGLSLNKNTVLEREEYDGVVYKAYLRVISGERSS